MCLCVCERVRERERWVGMMRRSRVALQEERSRDEHHAEKSNQTDKERRENNSIIKQFNAIAFPQTHSHCQPHKQKES